MLKYEFNETIKTVFGDKAIITGDICRINSNNYIIFYNNVAIIKSNIELVNRSNTRKYNTYNVNTKLIEDLVGYLIQIKKNITNNDIIPTKEELLNQIYQNISLSIKNYDKVEKREELTSKIDIIDGYLKELDQKLDPFENNILGNKENLRYLDINANMENIDKYLFEIRNKETDTAISINRNKDDKLYSIKTKINDNTTLYIRHFDSKKLGNNLSLVETMDDDTYISLNYNLTTNIITKKDNDSEQANSIHLGLFEEELKIALELINEQMYRSNEENNIRKLTR